MEYIFVVAGVVAAILLVAFFVLRKKSTRPPRPTEIITHTAGGVRVYSGSPVPLEVLAQIDRQLSDLFYIATTRGYSDFTQHPGYVVQVLPADSRCQNPAFIVEQEVVPGTNYDGSDYDRDPRPGFVALCVAGRFLETTGVIQVTSEGVLTSDIVRYEGEHKLLYEVDRPLYEATKIHGQGQGHPILS